MRLILPLLVISSLSAAPTLRLNTATVGPVSIAVGQNGPAQTIEAFNVGDGALALRLASSAAWVAPTLGASRNCTSRAGACLPIQLALNTNGLTKGVVTATVTVSDPNAVDAPQTITVTAQIGGGVPDRIDFLLPPNGSTADATFTTNSELRTQAGAPWLSVSLEGTGSFRFTYPYRVRATNLAGQGEGLYNTTLAVSNSTFAADNKSVPVTLRVTSSPIAKLAPDHLHFRVVQGSAKQTVNVPVTNIGLGTLTVTGGGDPTGGPWLSTGPAVNATVPVTVDPGNLAAGSYAGKLQVTSNAVNSPLTLNVDLDVVAAGPPTAAYQGVVDNATFEPGAPVGAGAILAIFGEQFIAGVPASATKLPLETVLGGARVLINGQPAPVYYASANQINFQNPYETPAGPATVVVERDGQKGNAISVDVVARAPKLLRLGIGDYGIMVNQDGTFPMPATPGIASHPARPGDALTVYAIGFGQTNPPVTSGTAAPVEPLARLDDVVVHFGRFLSTPVEVTPLYAGLTPGFVGLYQINVVVPEEAPRGSAVPMSVNIGAIVSNQVTLAIQ